MTYLVIAGLLLLIIIGLILTGLFLKTKPLTDEELEDHYDHYRLLGYSKSYADGKLEQKTHGLSRIFFFRAAGTAALLVLFTLLASFTTVDARAVGIQTAFGKYDKTLNAGAQLTAPWSEVEEFTTLLQQADLEGDQGVPVTFSGGGSGKVNSTFQWGISDKQGEQGAKALWEKYRTFETVQNFVLRAGRDAILNVSNDYTPNEARTKQDEIAAKVKSNLQGILDKYGIVLDSVSILSMPLDARTQASLDKIVEAQNDEQTALSKERRAETDARTAKKREAAGALSPAANQRYCLEVADAWDVAKNGPLPATFSCGLGNSNVLVGTK